MTPELAPGEVFEAVYPFVRSTFISHYQGDEGWVEDEIPTWTPGTRYADKGEGDIECIADAFGRVVLTVVSVHKPGRYPTRVFFTRTWVDPGGKPFGKTKCRVTTVPTFLTLTRGYRHEFVLAGCACEGCKWPHHDHRYGELLRQEARAI